MILGSSFVAIELLKELDEHKENLSQLWQDINLNQKPMTTAPITMVADWIN